MNPFKLLLKVFKSYTFGDKFVSALAVIAILLMIVKMMFFPYGLFNFGQPNVYTEGLISKNGIANINPLFVDYNEADREISALVFSGLLKYDAEKGAIVDDMAKLAVNEDKTVYTLLLREGLKWHDGAPVTAQDVYFTFHDVILDPAFSNEILKTNFAGIDIEMVDERTIQFSLEKPNVFFIANLVTGILPYHILKNVEPADLLQHEFNKKPTGTGPYMVTEPVKLFPDGRMQASLARNPYYYADLPEIENFRFSVYAYPEQLIADINSVNAVPKVTGKYILDFRNNDRFELVPYELPQYMAVFLNMESEILRGNEYVRLALRKAVDKDALIAKFVDKIPVDTPLMQLDQDEWKYQPDKDQAHGALKESGYNYGEDDTERVGIRYDEEGTALELRMIALSYPEGTEQAQETDTVLEFLEDSWASVGFSIKVELLERDEFKAKVMTRQYDLLYVGHNLGYNLDTYSYWHSTQANPRGQNFSNYKSFQVDTLIEEIRATFDAGEQSELLAKVAEKMKDDVPAVFLFRPIYYYATDGKVSGLMMGNVAFPSDRFSSVSSWVFN